MCFFYQEFQNFATSPSPEPLVVKKMSNRNYSTQSHCVENFVISFSDVYEGNGPNNELHYEGDGLFVVDSEKEFLNILYVEVSLQPVLRNDEVTKL